MSTSATKTFAGTPAPGGSEGPARFVEEGGRFQGGRNVSTVALNDELVGIGSSSSTPAKATMQFRWYSSGQIAVGFHVPVDRLHERQSHTRRLTYQTGTNRTSDRAEATFKVNPTRKYHMRIGGDGTYERASRAPGELSGLYGYWSSLNPQLAAA